MNIHGEYGVLTNPARVDFKWTTGPNGSSSVINSIYESPSDLWNEDAEECYIFVITNTKGKSVGVWLENVVKDGKTTWERLRDYILTDGRRFHFYNSSQIAKTATTAPAINNKIDSRKSVSLATLVHYLYYGEWANDVRVVDNGFCTYRSLLPDVPLFDYTRENLVSKNTPKHYLLNNITKGSGIRFTTRKAFVRGNGYLGVKYNSFEVPTNELYVGGNDIYNFYFTEDNPNIHPLFKIKGLSWELDDNKALRAHIGKAQISLIEVAWLCWHNKLDQNDFKKSLLGIHGELMSKKLRVDHLTHNRENNTHWAALLIPDEVNKQLRERDKIKKPFYFWSVYRQSDRTLRIKCGKHNDWEKRFYFHVETDPMAICSPEYSKILNSYVKLYEAFKSRLGENCWNKDENATSYLTEYSAFEQMFNANNPLLLMQNDSEEYVNLADVQVVDHILDDVAEV